MVIVIGSGRDCGPERESVVVVSIPHEFWYQVQPERKLMTPIMVSYTRLGLWMDGNMVVRRH